MLFHHFNKTVYKVAFFIVVLLLMLSPILPEKFETTMSFLRLNDKMEHMIAFFLLSFLLNRASSTIAHRTRNVLALLAFGIAIECIQYFIPNRSMSAYDVLADIAGIVLFQVLFSAYLYYLKRKQINYHEDNHNGS